MLSFFDYMKLRRFEADLKKHKIEYMQMYNAAFNTIDIRLRDVDTGRTISSQIGYRFCSFDYDIVVKEVLDLYQILKEGASL